jgi:N-acetyl-alpha-D-muramate 1-phosphate uridylyltransferase
MTTAFLLSAGLGTRLAPFTNEHPKALAVVNGKTLLQRNIEYLQQFDISNVVINVHHFANQIKEAVTKNKGWGSTIQFSDETNELLETGGAIVKAKDLLVEQPNFLVMNVDILTNLNIDEMYAHHLDYNALATVAVTHRSSHREFLFTEQLQLVGWRNNKTKEQKWPKGIPAHYQGFAFSGVHIINNKFFNLPLMQGKFSMVDQYLDLCISNKIVCFNHSGDKLQDVGSNEGLEKAAGLFA